MTYVKIILVGFLAAFLAIGLPMNSGQANETNVAYWMDAADAQLIRDLDLAVGEAHIIRLTTEIPKGKTLKAYSAVITYDPSVVSVEATINSVDSVFRPNNLNTNTMGTISFNGFDVNGVEGPGIVSFLDISVKGIKSGSLDLFVSFKGFGTSAGDQFIPAIEPLPITIR